jgi:molybdopterin-guanine dinucleotide biosynthesis protein
MPSPLDSVLESLGSAFAASPVLAPLVTAASAPPDAAPSSPLTVGGRDLFEGTGGVRFQGFDAEALVPLIVVDIRELSENKICLGAIGSSKRSGRFCVRSNCNTAAHRTKERTVEEWRVNGITEMLCVRVPASQKSTGEAAFVDPSLALAQMESSDYFYHLTEQRSLNNWVMIFSQLRGIIRDRVDDQEDEQASSNLAHRLERAAEALPTPAKRRREMEDLDDSSPLTVDLTALPTADEFVTNEADRVLFKNQNQLKSALDDVNDSLRALVSNALSVEGFKQHSSDKLNALEGGIGKRPPQYTAPTIWQAVQDLEQDIVDSRGSVVKEVQRSLEEISESMTKNLNYVVESQLKSIKIPKEVATKAELAEALSKLETRIAGFLRQTLEGGLLTTIKSIT